MKIPEFEGLFDMHSEYLLPGMRAVAAFAVFAMPLLFARHCKGKTYNVCLHFD